ncbi:MAG: HAMP domain-containing histidine kinase, partial [Phycisphaerales bacterium]|nr:HAMP domain-containing histidine kinase [Phycisphaerales bacterium]
TVLAVLRQGEVILEQRSNLLRQSAAESARTRQNQITTELAAAFARASEAWNNETLAGLDLWAADLMQSPASNQSVPWRTVLFEMRRNDWVNLPFTPLQPDNPASLVELLPMNDRPAYPDSSDAPPVMPFGELATREEIGPRAYGLVGLAAADARRKDWSSAAVRLLSAGLALENEPRFVRHSFGVRLARVDALLAVNDTSEALHELSRIAERFPRSRLSLLETALLGERAGRIRELASAANGPDQTSKSERRNATPDALETFGAMLSAATTSARKRADDAALAAELRDESRWTESGDAVRFVTMRRQGAPTMVVAISTVGARRLAIVGAATDVISAYWGLQDWSGEWRVVLADQTPMEDRIMTLGNAFGNAVITATSESVNRANELQMRQFSLLIFSAAGSVLAWMVVIWLMQNVMARQRELVVLQRRFVADVSHELKTPLALIRLMAETLASGRLREQARVDHYLSTITRESERLSVLIDNILDFSNMEAGRKRYELGPCSLNLVVQQAWALFEPQFAKDGFMARLIVQPDIPTIRADSAALQQLVVNLLQNAYRYGAEGKYVALSAQRSGDTLVIEVEDHGIGMTRKQMQRIGQSFFRADDPRVRKTRGTGLGLTIVKHIIAAHGGKLVIESKPGKGSVFSVRLPLGGAARRD